MRRTYRALLPKRAALATRVPLPDHSGSSDENFFVMRIVLVSRAGARPVLAIALVFTALASVVRAQVPAPPPAPPPLTEPSVPILPGAPSQLISVPGVVATPLLTPVAIPTAIPTPAPRLFNCSCFTTTSGTQWAGTVTASSYFAASSAATGACLSYITSAPQSPFLPPGQSPGLSNAPTTTTGSSSTTSSTSSSTSSSSGGLPTTSSSNSPVNALKNSPAQTGQTECNVCACN
jgi:hypothetical protein